MKLVTPLQMSAIDRTAIEKIGIPGAVLMENAAIAVASEAKEMMNGAAEAATATFETSSSAATSSGTSFATASGKHICSFRKRFVVIAGKGNNGGDGFAAARHLRIAGFEVEVFLLAHKSEIAGDALINMNIAEKSGISITEIIDPGGIDTLRKALGRPCIVIDALYGTGLKGEVTGVPRDVIEAVNASCNSVLAVDIPSGINGETGEISGVCIEAARTVTFGFAKLGAVIPPGCEKAGLLKVAGIGMPEEAWKDQKISTFLLDAEELKGIVPKRKRVSNKGDYGRVLLITGSTGMTGAGCLSASSALRAGAGLVYLAVPSSLSDIYAKNVKEAILIPLEDEGRGALSAKCEADILSALKGKSAVAIGPGLSGAGDVPAVVDYVCGNAEIPLVIDADALNCISGDLSILAKVKRGAVLTPHPGEMSRLTGLSIDYIQQHRLETAREFAAKWNVIVVLKGFRTVIAVPAGKAYINVTGNPGMATAGTGDVLTGIIAALAGQGLTLEEAAVAGVYLHGRAGDLAAQDFGEYSLMASDLISKLPEAFEEITE